MSPLKVSNTPSSSDVAAHDAPAALIALQKCERLGYCRAVSQLQLTGQIRVPRTNRDNVSKGIWAERRHLVSVKYRKHASETTSGCGKSSCGSTGWLFEAISLPRV